MTDRGNEDQSPRPRPNAAIGSAKGLSRSGAATPGTRPGLGGAVSSGDRAFSRTLWFRHHACRGPVGSDNRGNGRSRRCGLGG